MAPSSPQKNSLMEEISGGHQLGINDRLGLISLIDEGMRVGSSSSPVMSDLFSSLWELVNATVSGSRINVLKPDKKGKGFQVFEITAETGESIGRLNMLYFKKPLPCYYLVYVEVAAPFRRQGLGNRILDYFRDFLEEKSALGVLDNIIPEEEPTYGIYDKHAWEPIEAIIGTGMQEEGDHYMIFVPTRLRCRELREPVLKLLHHLKRKRAAIDMRDNELMVQRTIAEFKDLYTALLAYFDGRIGEGAPDALMRFMFTRFVTKLVAFRRRIADLIGYTGGGSIEQISLRPEIAALPVQSYAPAEVPAKPSFVDGDMDLFMRLPPEVIENPARAIESLPNYQRPNYMEWLKAKGLGRDHTLTIGDLMDIGFDPTRLKEMEVDGKWYIFERIQVRMVPSLERKKDILDRARKELAGARVRNALFQVNPPLVTIRDRGNAYVLRRKIDGIHWEEAIEQLQSREGLKALNETMKVDRLILSTVRRANDILADRLGVDESVLAEQVVCFVSWNLELNQPKLMIDFAGSSLEGVWMA
ncbi:MAG: hypothetical protein ABII06_21625 [Pseudomonadota bacterium]